MDNMFNEKMRVEKLEKNKKSKAKSKAKLRVEGDMVCSIIIIMLSNTISFFSILYTYLKHIRQ